MPSLSLPTVLLSIALVLGLLGLALWIRADLMRRQAGLGASRRLVQQDVDQRYGRDRVLYDAQRQLYGSPDYVSEESIGGDLRLVPIEAKPTRRSRVLYESDELQALVYWLLVRATWPDQVAPYARVTYAPGFGPFEVEPTPERLRRLDAKLAKIRHERTAKHVARDHRQPARCGACAVATACGSERLSVSSRPASPQARRRS